MDDRALVDAVRAGDRTAFAELVERETSSVYRVCLRILGRHHEAEEVTQESMLQAYRAIGGYRGDGALRGWLLRIATRQAFRRLGQRRSVASIDEVPEPILADHGADPALQALGRERQRAIRAAVRSLEEPYREVVALRFFGELSLAEIAESTGRPVNTVKTHLRRGLERLQPMIDTARADR